MLIRKRYNYLGLLHGLVTCIILFVTQPLFFLSCSETENESGLKTIQSWRYLRADAYNSGRSHYPGPQAGRLVWANPETDWSAPIVIDSSGCIYVNGKVIRPDGTLKFDLNCGFSVLGADDMIYCSRNHVFTCFNQNGTVSWSISLDDTAPWSYEQPNPSFYLIDHLGNIIVGSYWYNVGEFWGRIRILNSSGSFVNNYVQSEAVRSMALLPDGNFLTLETNYRDHLIYRNPLGEIVWLKEVYPPVAYPLIDPHGIIFMRNSSGIKAVDFDGNQIWGNRRLPIHQWYGSTSFLAQGKSGTIYLVARNELDPYGSDDLFLYALSRQGTILWKSYLPGSFTPPTTDITPVVDSEEYIYVNTETSIVAYDRTGLKIWEYHDQSTSIRWLALSPDGTLYASTTNKGVYAFRDW